jgi:hypothetical protein
LNRATSIEEGLFMAQQAAIRTRPATAAKQTAAREATRVKATAAGQGRVVARTASQDVRELAGTVRGQAEQVTGELAGQARDLLNETRGQLRSQADAQTSQLARALFQVGGQAVALSEGRPEQAGPLADYAEQAATWLDTCAAQIEDRGIEGLASDVVDFARRRPGLFLAGAAVLGVGVGRLIRSGAVSSTPDSDGTNGSNGINGSAGYGGVAGYGGTGYQGLGA